jgi:hypothetical protein
MKSAVIRQTRMSAVPPRRADYNNMLRAEQCRLWGAGYTIDRTIDSKLADVPRGTIVPIATGKHSDSVGEAARFVLGAGEAGRFA